MAAQALQRGMAELAGPAGAEAAADALRIVDTYIKVCSHCCLRVWCGLGASRMVCQARAPGPGPPRTPRSAIFLEWQMGRVSIFLNMFVQMTSLHHWQAAYGPLQAPLHWWDSFPTLPSGHRP